MESDYQSDEYQKKRDRENYDEYEFGRSKRIQRTPPKHTKQPEEKLDMILKLMQEMKTDLRNEIQQVRADQKLYAEEIMNLRRENEELKNDNKKIKEEISQIKQRLEYMEKDKRKNNVVLSGLRMDTADTTILRNKMENFIKTNLNLNISVENARKIGDWHCLIELKNERVKQEIMENKHKLRDIPNERIYLNNDSTKEERRIQKELRKFAKSEKEKGKETKIGYNKVTINGEEWRWDQIREKLIKTNPKN